MIDIDRKVIYKSILNLMLLRKNIFTEAFISAGHTGSIGKSIQILSKNKFYVSPANEVKLEKDV